MAQIDYGGILKRSVAVTRKHKWLWVYGMLLASLGGSSFGGGGSGNRSGAKIENLQDIPEKTSKVLGAVTDQIGDWFANVPTTTWVLLGLGFFLFFVLIIIIFLIIRMWAKASLIHGLHDGLNDQTVTLSSTSLKGLSAIKHLLLLGVISALIGLGVFLGFAFVAGIGFLLLSILPILGVIWMGISVILGVCFAIYAALILTMTGIYAERLVILKKLTPWQAWKKGLRLSRKNFIATLLMGILNTGIGCMAGCLGTIILLSIFGIPLFLIGATIMGIGLTWTSVPLLFAIVAFGMLFITLLQLINGLIIIFKTANWNQLFSHVYKET